MVRKHAAVTALAIFVAVFPATASAQDAKAILSAAMKAMGAENLNTIQYSAAGSNEGARVKSYKREIDLNAGTARTEIVRVKNAADQAETQTISAASGWETQFDYWSSPHAFLKGAIANNAAVKEATQFGEKYNVVSYTVQNKHRITGYLDSANMVYKVETTLPNNVSVQSLYRDYTDFGGLKFPTIIIQKHGGENNTWILIVDNAKANTGGGGTGK